MTTNKKFLAFAIAALLAVPAGLAMQHAAAAATPPATHATMTAPAAADAETADGPSTGADKADTEQPGDKADTEQGAANDSETNDSGPDGGEGNG
ncbi:MAG TPA: hypothetical protein VIG32_11705 [Candidatus Baltobacteraceae bacterium]|jgi:hypothetical protein